MKPMGPLLVVAGVVGLAWAGIRAADTNAGGIAAVSLLLVILGFVFYFPSLLDDDTHQTSTMRVVVLLVVSLFMVLTMKAGWEAHSLADLQLQEKWVWVLVAALGGKAAQSFSENQDGGLPFPKRGRAADGDGAKQGTPAKPRDAVIGAPDA